MKPLLVIVAFGLCVIALPSEGVSFLSAAQVPAGPLATMPPDTEPAFEVATIKLSPGGVEWIDPSSIRPVCRVGGTSSWSGHRIRRSSADGRSQSGRPTGSHRPSPPRFRNSLA